MAFGKRVYASIDELQRDLAAWMREYNEVCSDRGRRF